jgi:hypothetical protein
MNFDKDALIEIALIRYAVMNIPCFFLIFIHTDYYDEPKEPDRGRYKKSNCH